MSIFLRKLCALIGDSNLYSTLECLNAEEGRAAQLWWERHQESLEAIASSSDRVNLETAKQAPPPYNCQTSHQRSGANPSSSKQCHDYSSSVDSRSS